MVLFFAYFRYLSHRIKKIKRRWYWIAALRIVQNSLRIQVKGQGFRIFVKRFLEIIFDDYGFQMGWRSSWRIYQIILT